MSQDKRAKLDDGDQALLDHLHGLVQKGYAWPTPRDLGAVGGGPMRSVSVAHLHLRKLRERGYVQIEAKGLVLPPHEIYSDFDELRKSLRKSRHPFSFWVFYREPAKKRPSRQPGEQPSSAGEPDRPVGGRRRSRREGRAVETRG